MLTTPRSKLTYPNVMSTLAIFLALGGSAFAVAALKKNAVGPKQIKANAVRAAEIKANAVGNSEMRNNAVGGAEVIDNSLGGLEVNESSFGEVPSAANADQLGGFAGSNYIRFGGTIPSGATIAGVFGSYDKDTDDNSSQSVAHGYVSFPAAAPADLTNADVNYAQGSSLGSDNDPSCTGTTDSPTAPAGKVCLYEAGPDGAGNVGTSSGGALSGGGSRTRYGFVIRGPTNNAEGEAVSDGTWAYTAP